MLKRLTILGFYQSTGHCLLCSDRFCQSCSGLGQCARCQDGYYLLSTFFNRFKFGNLFYFQNFVYLIINVLFEADKCFRACPRGYFGDTNSGRCVECPPHCLSCASGRNCTQCDDTTFLLPNADLLTQGQFV